jgi:hypothetical protein
MKHSHENSGGRGAKIILPLFKSLLVDLKHRCLGFTPADVQADPEQARVQDMIEQSKQVLEQLDDESLLPYFMQGLASGSAGTMRLASHSPPAFDPRKPPAYSTTPQISC